MTQLMMGADFGQHNYARAVPKLHTCSTFYVQITYLLCTIDTSVSARCTVQSCTIMPQKGCGPKLCQEVRVIPQDHEYMYE